MINKFDAQDLHRTLHSTTGEYTVSKNHITFMKTDDTLGTAQSK